MDTIELAESRAMIEIPEDAVEIEMTVKVFHNGEILKVSKTLNMHEVREAIRKADEGYIDDEDKFVITDKGRALLGLSDASLGEK